MTYINNLIRFSIAELGYTAIAYEADFIACQAINDYITDKVDSLDYLSLSGFPINEKTRETFEWMRSWNKSTRKNRHKVVQWLYSERRDESKRWFVIPGGFPSSETTLMKSKSFDKWEKIAGVNLSMFINVDYYFD